jgi:RNA polymerase sigma factor (sigma-70 family)
LRQCKLDFDATFYFDDNVPADDQVTSLTGLGGSAHHGAAAFATTHWSVVLTAQGESPAAQEALGKLCRTYWRPVYSFVRRQGAGPEEAEDLTQGFFALLLERHDLDAVRKEKGRLRSYLLTSLKHFLASEQRRTMAVKRGKGQRLVPLEELSAIERTEMEPTDPLSADRLYERRWASTLMEQVLRRLKDEYRVAGHAALFDSLKQLLTDEPGTPSRVEIAAQLGMTENAIRQAFHRFRHRYQVLLREEIAHTVAIASDIEDELRHLISVLRA